MTRERMIRLVAGVLVLTGLGLSLVSKWWLLLTAFVGLNLFQSSLTVTGWCLADDILKFFGVKSEAEKRCGEESRKGSGSR